MLAWPMTKPTNHAEDCLRKTPYGRDDRFRLEGACDPAFAAVRDAFERNFRKRNEIGAAVCVYRDGNKVVDLVGRHKDLAGRSAWRADTSSS